MALAIADVIEARDATKTTTPRRTTLIALAEQKLDATFYGDSYNEAVALLVLHMYAKDARTGAGGGPAPGGALTAEAEGRASRSYGAATAGTTASMSEWSSTMWGLELIELTQSIQMRPLNRMM